VITTAHNPPTAVGQDDPPHAMMVSKSAPRVD
jgi:hypothetical protein